MASNQEIYALTVFNMIATRFGLRPEDVNATTQLDGGTLQFRLEKSAAPDERHANLVEHLRHNLGAGRALDGEYQVERSSVELLRAMDDALTTAPASHAGRRGRSGAAPAR